MASVVTYSVSQSRNEIGMRLVPRRRVLVRALSPDQPGLSRRPGPTSDAATQYPSANISRRGSAAAIKKPVSGSRYVIVPSPDA